MYVCLRASQSGVDSFLCCHYRSQSAVTSTFARILVAPRIPDVSLTRYLSSMNFFHCTDMILTGDLTIFNSNSSTGQIEPQVCSRSYTTTRINCGVQVSELSISCVILCPCKLHWAKCLISKASGAGTLESVTGTVSTRTQRRQAACHYPFIHAFKCIVTHASTYSPGWIPTRVRWIFLQCRSEHSKVHEKRSSWELSAQHAQGL
jgi:hypothetical protein